MNRHFSWKLTVLTFLLCFISVCHAEAKDIGWGIPKGENHEQPWPGQEFDDIIRQNDAYNGYAGNDNVQGNMSRADAVMVLAKALANAAKDPVKKSTMVQTALKEYSNGNIVMEPQGSFTKLLATKGFESIA